jgi:hypothetical protein
MPALSLLSHTLETTNLGVVGILSAVVKLDRGALRFSRVKEVVNHAINKDSQYFIELLMMLRWQKCSPQVLNLSFHIQVGLMNNGRADAQSVIEMLTPHSRM